MEIGTARPKRRDCYGHRVGDRHGYRSGCTSGRRNGDPSARGDDVDLASAAASAAAFEGGDPRRQIADCGLLTVVVVARTTKLCCHRVGVKIIAVGRDV
jgi:hypothetical protein